MSDFKVQDNVIRATKGGWLIASKVVHVTNKYYHCEDKDKKGVIIKVRKDAQDGVGCFNNPDDAMQWMETASLMGKE